MVSLATTYDIVSTAIKNYIDGANTFFFQLTYLFNALGWSTKTVGSVGYCIIPAYNESGPWTRINVYDPLVFSTTVLTLPFISSLNSVMMNVNSLTTDVNSVIQSTSTSALDLTSMISTSVDPDVASISVAVSSLTAAIGGAKSTTNYENCLRSSDVIAEAQNNYGVQYPQFVIPIPTPPKETTENVYGCIQAKQSLARARTTFKYLEKVLIASNTPGDAIFRPQILGLMQVLLNYAPTTTLNIWKNVLSEINATEATRAAQCAIPDLTGTIASPSVAMVRMDALVQIATTYDLVLSTIRNYADAANTFFVQIQYLYLPLGWKYKTIGNVGYCIRQAYNACQPGFGPIAFTSPTNVQTTIQFPMISLLNNTLKDVNSLILKSNSLMAMTSTDPGKHAVYKRDNIDNIVQTIRNACLSLQNAISNSKTTAYYDNCLRSPSVIYEALTNYQFTYPEFATSVSDLRFDQSNSVGGSSIFQQTSNVVMSKSSHRCSSGETNAFILTQAPIVLISSCLTGNGAQEDYKSDVQRCIINRLPSLGISSLTIHCLDCVFMFVQMVNKIPSKVLRDTCIGFPTSSECLDNIDTSAFASCSGFDFFSLNLQPYCTATENQQLIAWSFYRTAMVTCVPVAQNSDDMDKCLRFVAINSGKLNSLHNYCLDCWRIFFKALHVAPVQVRDSCTSDPVSEFCRNAIAGDLVPLIACIGYNPIQFDFAYIRANPGTSSSTRTRDPHPILGIILTATMILLM